jgi:hypothetical protein
MKRAQRAWWQGPIPIIGTVAVVLIIVGIFIYSANQPSGTDALLGKPVPSSIVNAVTSTKSSVVSQVGTGGLPSPLRKISGPALSPASSKPELLYIGGEFCPHCAALRWSLVNALSRFGSFSNLGYMRSAVTDGDISTFTFYQSGYTSKYINFVPVENEDRAHNPKQTLTSQQATLLSTLGGNGYPFLDFAGKYTYGATNTYPGGYNPSILSGLTWQQVASALKNPADPVTQAVIGNANYDTAALCKLTKNQPRSACGSSTILNIEQQLP